MPRMKKMCCDVPSVFVSPHDIMTNERVCRAWIKQLEKQLRSARKVLKQIVKGKC